MRPVSDAELEELARKFSVGRPLSNSSWRSAGGVVKYYLDTSALLKKYVHETGKIGGKAFSLHLGR